MTWEDMLLAFAILLLSVEIMKSTRIGMRTVIDHILSMGLFIVMLVEFLLVRAGRHADLLVSRDDQPGRRARRLHRHHPQFASASIDDRRRADGTRSRTAPAVRIR